MDMLVNYMLNLYDIIRDIWAYVLVGIFMSFMVQYAIPKRLLLSSFKKNSFSSIVRASMFGFMVSSFSFGAVPIIAHLRRKGATIANSIAMLIASPWGGFVQIAILTKYVGIANMMLLFSFSIIASILIGLIFVVLEGRGLLDKKKRVSDSVLEECDCKIPDEFWDETKSDELFNIVIESGKNLLIGVVVAALMLTIFNPPTIFVWFGSDVKSLLYALPFATIFESVEEGLALLAGLFYIMGAELGVVFMFMMVGVITDVKELKMLDLVFGRKTTSYYILIGIAVSSLLSYILNLL